MTRWDNSGTGIFCWIIPKGQRTLQTKNINWQRAYNMICTPEKSSMKETAKIGIRSQKKSDDIHDLFFFWHSPVLCTVTRQPNQTPKQKHGTQRSVKEDERTCPHNCQHFCESHCKKHPQQALSAAGNTYTLQINSQIFAFYKSTAKYLHSTNLQPLCKVMTYTIVLYILVILHGAGGEGIFSPF